MADSRAAGRAPRHVPLRDSKPCGNTIRIASSSMMLRPGAHSERPEESGQRLGDAEEDAGEQRAGQVADAAEDDDREGFDGQAEALHRD